MINSYPYIKEHLINIQTKFVISFTSKFTDDTATANPDANDNWSLTSLTYNVYVHTYTNEDTARLDTSRHSLHTSSLHFTLSLPPFYVGLVPYVRSPIPNGV